MSITDNYNSSFILYKFDVTNVYKFLQLIWDQVKPYRHCFLLTKPSGEPSKRAACRSATVYVESAPDPRQVTHSWLLTNHGAEERRAHVCLFVREQRMWHACPSQMIGIPGETPLQKCIPSAADAVVSLMITALIKYWRFDEDPSPQEPSHKHKEVTVHMFRPLKGCQDFCLNYLWYVWQYLKG